MIILTERVNNNNSTPSPSSPGQKTAGPQPPLVCDQFGLANSARAFVAWASFPPSPVNDAWIARIRLLQRNEPAGPSFVRNLSAIDRAMQQIGLEYWLSPVSEARSGLLDTGVLPHMAQVISNHKAECRMYSLLATASLKTLGTTNVAFVVTPEHVFFGVTIAPADAAGLATIPLADANGHPSSRVLVPIEATMLGEGISLQDNNAHAFEYLTAALGRHGTMIIDTSGRLLQVVSSAKPFESCQQLTQKRDLSFGPPRRWWTAW